MSICKRIVMSVLILLNSRAIVYTCLSLYPTFGPERQIITEIV